MVGAKPTAAATPIRMIAARTTKTGRTTLRPRLSSSVRPKDVRVVNRVVMTSHLDTLLGSKSIPRRFPPNSATRGRQWPGTRARPHTFCVSARGDAYIEPHSRRRTNYRSSPVFYAIPVGGVLALVGDSYLLPQRQD